MTTKTFFFVLIDLTNAEIETITNYLNKLNIKNKKVKDKLYIYLNNFNVINFVYNLLLVSLIINVKNIKNVKLKLNKNIIANYNAAMLLINIFNNIKNYNKNEIETDNNNIVKSKQTLNLNNKNCLIETKNKFIKENLQDFLVDKYFMLEDLIENVNKKSKNPFLKKFNNILQENLKIRKLEEGEIIDDLF